MKYLYFFLLSCCFTVNLFGQHAYGTTELLFAPTAEIQKEKTVMIGGVCWTETHIVMGIGTLMKSIILTPIITT